jgi:integrase/recombinase XerD
MYRHIATIVLLFPGHLQERQTVAAIYMRVKVPSKGWRYKAVSIRQGRRAASVQPPFYLRYSVNGKQAWSEPYQTLKEAHDEAKTLEHALEAKSQGLTVTELDEITDANRVPIKTAIEDYLHVRRNKARKTVIAYTSALEEFRQSIPRSVRYVDELKARAGQMLEKFKTCLEDEGYSPKTQYNRLHIACFFLKANGVKDPSKLVVMPTVEQEDALPYENEELKTLFAHMDAEETIRYKFFLGTAARDKEVTFVAWQDINFQTKTYTVRSKPEVGFTVKSHESRTIPLPDELAEMLKARKKSPPHPRWIFVNEDGKPDNHFLRKLKRIAHRAGLNCGQCRTTNTKGKYDGKKEIEVTCKTDPVCKHIYLHRLRKTSATRWQHAGIPVRDIQKWLGHKSLETTEIYLGTSQVDDKMREKLNHASNGD